MKANRVSRIDPNRHLTILLNSEIQTAAELAQNAKLILKFIKQMDDVNKAASKIPGGRFFRTKTTKLNSALAFSQ